MNDEDSPVIYAHVCGQDGVAYGNDCYARNAGITHWDEGDCRSLNFQSIHDLVEIQSIIFLSVVINTAC